MSQKRKTELLLVRFLNQLGKKDGQSPIMLSCFLGSESIAEGVFFSEECVIVCI